MGVDAVAVLLTNAAGGHYCAAVDDNVASVDAVAVCRAIAAGGGQRTRTGDGEVNIVVGATGGDAVAFFNPLTAGAGDGVVSHQHKIEGTFLDIVDGGAFVTVKHIPAADGGVPQCQGLSVPHDVVVVGGRAVFRHGAVLVRQGIGGGILVAGQPHAAHVDVGLGVIVTAGVGVGVRGLRHLAVEVLGVGDEVGDIGLRGKRRTSDCHNAGRVLTCCDRNLPVAGWEDNDIACVVEYGLCASLRRDSAAGDGEVDVYIDAIAVVHSIAIAAGGIHGAALDNKVVSEDSVTLRYHIAAGSGQAAAAGDGEVNTILTVAIGVDTETGVVVAVGTGDGVVSRQFQGNVVLAAVVDGGAP